MSERPALNPLEEALLELARSALRNRAARERLEQDGKVKVRRRSAA